MVKKVWNNLFIISCIFIFTFSVNVYANPQSSSFEDKYSEGGYKSLESAVNAFEKYYNTEVKLPTIPPTISFTHKFGKFYVDSDYNLNTTLNLIFVNEDIKENIFKIDIRSLKHKLDFEGESYPLKDGSKGVYFEHQIYNFFVFEKNNLQYMFGVHKKGADSIKPELLVEMANSI